MKRRLKIIALGIIVGILAVVLKNILDIPKDQFVKYLWVSLVVIIIGIVLINLSYFLYYHHKLKKLVKLSEQKEHDSAIKQINQLKGKAKGRHLNNIIDITRAVFYFNASRTTEAIEILEKMDTTQINKSLLNAYYLVLCNAYFIIQNSEKAMEIYNQHQSDFKAMEKSEKDLSYIYLIHSYSSVYHQDWDMAEKHLEQLKIYDTNHNFIKEIQILSKLIEEKKIEKE